MIASENVLLPDTEFYLNDFMHRYAEGRPYERYYNGTKIIDEIEQSCSDYFKQHFSIPYADVRSVSGAGANLAVFNSLGQKCITNSLPSGGHITHNKMGTMQRILNREIYNFPTTEDGFHTDIDKAKKMISEVNPDFIVFGKSMFLFPEPVQEIRDGFPDLKIVYDGAHVFGLIYQGEFQSPLKEDADILTASTHKTFPGQQGGIILSKHDKDSEIMKKIERTIFPGLLSNHHLHRIPALLATAIMLDTDERYKDYAKRIIKNAKTFAETLNSQGFKVCCEEFGFTQSHQVVLDVSSLGGGHNVANKLEENGIICNKNALPWDTSVVNPSGIRLGTQEMTLKGWKESDFKGLAERFVKILIKNKPRESNKIEARL